MIKILATSPDLNFIENAINRYFYSKDYYINVNLEIKNKKFEGKQKVDYHFRVRKIKNRYQFIYDSRDKV